MTLQVLSTFRMWEEEHFGKGGVGGSRYGTIKRRHSVGRGVYESGAFVLNLGLDEIIQRVDRN